MARTTNKISGRPPKRPVTRRKKTRKTGKLKAWLLPGILAAIILVSLAATVYLVFLRQNPAAPYASGEKPLPGPATTVEPRKKKVAIPREILPVHEEPAPPLTAADQPDNTSQTARQGTAEKPRVAIIIDDLGYRQDIGAALLDMDMEITFSFLPFAPNTVNQARQAALRKRDVLLHLPMQASDPKWDPGPGTLTVDMGREDIRRVFNGDLAAVPHAIGVNNHMGSLFTTNRQTMGNLLEILRERGLFFVDSVTSPESIGASLAVAMGIKTARRHVFLDNDQDREKIREQFASLVKIAEKHGWAVGIGHPHPATIEGLQEFNHLYGNRVDTVGISSLVY